MNENAKRTMAGVKLCSDGFCYFKTLIQDTVLSNAVTFSGHLTELFVSWLFL